MRLCLQSAAPGCSGRPCRDPFLGWLRRALDQPYQILQCSGPVAFLCAMTLRRDQQCTLLGESLTGKSPQPRDDFIRQSCFRRIEAQLHSRRDLIDVLAARSRCTDEAFADRSFVDRDGRSDTDHAIAPTNERSSAAPLLATGRPFHWPPGFLSEPDFLGQRGACLRIIW